MRRSLIVLKWMALTLGGVLLGLVLAMAGLGLWLTQSLPRIDGPVQVAGLSAPAEVIRDRNGVAHIRAASEADGYFTLGFVHAQDRLFQMDLYRRIGAGRLAELVGAPALPADRILRTLGIYRLAEKQVAALSPDLRLAVTAYTAGVNAFIAQHRGPWPPEFTLLFYRPEPWTPADSLVLGKLLALMLGGNWTEELRRAALLDRLPPEAVEFFLPTAPDGPLRLTGQTSGTGEMATALLAAVPAFLHPRRASNAWAVTGTRTASGAPILASDPHLGFTAPGIWYPVRLTTPQHVVTGATLPGLPLHLLGHTGSVAWGLTTTYGDQTDLFVETVDAADAQRYATPDGPQPFATRRETIRVRFGRDIAMTVRETRHGPVVSDVLPNAAAQAGQGRVMALSAVALQEGDRTPEALLGMNRATDADSFRAALRDFHTPQQNVFFADRFGSIGFVAAARVPVRKTDRGLVPGNGASGAQDWTGFLDFDELPQAMDPPSGQIYNGNNRVVDDDYPYFIGADWDLNYRAERIAELLAEGERPRADDHARMQVDTLSPMARDLLPLLLRAMNEVDTLSPAARNAVTRLHGWDHGMDRARPEPLLFSAWMRALAARLFADEMGGAFSTGQWPRQIRTALTEEPRWCDDIRTPAAETCPAQVAGALDDAIASLTSAYGADIGNWRWGTAHAVRFTHPAFSFIPGLGRLLGIELDSDGGNYTLKRGGFSGSGARFPNGHGASYRAVYDLGNLDDSRYAYAPGASGNPYSRWFSDQAPLWRDGLYFRIPATPEDAKRDARGVLALTPR